MGNNVSTIEISPEQEHKTTDESGGPLLTPGQCDEMRTRWESIQAGFVDEPQDSVKQADRLVSDAIRALSETFAAEREKLERQWSQNGQASTKDLRQALRRYRMFFQRLLAV